MSRRGCYRRRGSRRRPCRCSTTRTIRSRRGSPDTPDRDERDPVELAARALRHRDRSRSDLDQRLARAGIDEREREEAIARLERIGYVDDRRFATTRAQGLAERGYGDAAIRHALEREGIEREDIEEIVDALEAERDRAAAIVAGRGAGSKTAALLRRRGFDPDSVEAALGGALRGDGPPL